nr:hypothetical protein [Ktedonobacterales bacterium]
VLALPVVVVTVARFASELGGNVTWVPAARRAALGPALSTLALAAGALFAGVWAGATALGWQRVPLLTLNLGGSVVLAPTWRALALFAALALPFGLLFELPYRVGIRRWRASWRRELATRRADLESHVRRLSAADPRSGAQDTSEENLRAMQYDLVLLEFYRAKDTEARGISGAPLRLAGLLVAPLLALVGALVVDGVSAGVALGPLVAALVAPFGGPR